MPPSSVILEIYLRKLGCSTKGGSLSYQDANDEKQIAMVILQ